jgi:hypothetical protein
VSFINILIDTSICVSLLSTMIQIRESSTCQATSTHKYSTRIQII